MAELVLIRTAVDAKLMQRSGLDEVSLYRARRAFIQWWTKRSYKEKKVLTEGAVSLRFRRVAELLEQVWPREVWLRWLQYLEHTQEDIDEMCRGEYPISPYIVRLFSALLGIKTDYLVFGAWPMSHHAGTDIDILPAIGGEA